MDKLVVAVLTCGREEYLDETILSWESLSNIGNSSRVIFDDSGSEDYRDMLSKKYPQYKIVGVSDKNLGLNYAYNFAFKYLKNSGFDYTLWIEDDQKLLRTIDVEDMVDVLTKNNLLQLSTIRKPFFHNELGYKNVVDFLVNTGWPIEQRDKFVMHSAMWANHPNIFMNSILEVEYPADLDTATSEMRFGKKLLSYFPRRTFGFYGNIDDEPQSEHTGKNSMNTINYYWGEDE
jgi:hypothetical protein